MLHGLPAEFRIHAALDNGKHHLLIAVERIRPVKMTGEAFQPALREFEGFGGVALVGIPGAAFVQGHDDIGPDDALGIHVVFRREDVLAAVYVGGEFAAFLREFADGRKRKHLEAAAVREDGAVPVLEFVQAAGLI